MVVSGAFKGENLFCSLFAAGDWVTKGIVPHSVGGSPVVPRALVSTHTGKAPLSGRVLESSAGHRQPVRGGLSHP